MKPNFKPTDVVKTITELTQKGLKVVDQATLGTNWNDVVAPLDEFEFELGQYTSVNSHLNSVLFSEEFNAEYEKPLPLITNFILKLAPIKPYIKLIKILKRLI